MSMIGSSLSCRLQAFNFYLKKFQHEYFPDDFSKYFRTVYFEKTYLTHFLLLVSFDTPWKYQKTKVFLMFSVGIERDQWHEVG